MSEPIEAVCVFTTGCLANKIKGYVLFNEDLFENKTLIKIKLSGVSEGLHGFHIHKTGDLREQCTSLCSHYNPYNKNHGGLNDNECHVGDLGNIIADKNKNVKMKIKSNFIKLRGNKSIIGRSLIIHEDPDDLGKGKNEDSLKTGNSGKRIACGIIGISKNSKYHNMDEIC